MKLLIILVFLGILFALGSAFISMTRGSGKDSKATVRALTWRIALSLGLFLFLFLAYKMGWIQPHGLMPE